MSFCLVTETFNLLQKPGGIISLLDEAWYAAIIYVCLLFSASIFDHVIIEFLLGFLDSFHVYVPLPSVVDELTFLTLRLIFALLFHAACSLSLHMRRLHRSCTRLLKIINVLSNQSFHVLILLLAIMQGR